MQNPRKTINFALVIELERHIEILLLNILLNNKSPIFLLLSSTDINLFFDLKKKPINKKDFLGEFKEEFNYYKKRENDLNNQNLELNINYNYL